MQDYLAHQSLAEHEVSRHQLLQGLLHLARKELDQNSPLVLVGGASLQRPGGQRAPDAPMFVLTWECLSVLCQQLHGPVEKIASEVCVWRTY